MPTQAFRSEFPFKSGPTALTFGSRCRIRCPCPLRLVRLPPRLRTKGQAGADPGRLRPDARRARVGRHHSSDLPRPGGPSGRPLPGAVSRRSAPSRTRPASASRRQRQPGKGNYWVARAAALSEERPRMSGGMSVESGRLFLSTPTVLSRKPKLAGILCPGAFA
jgi:hypothetical protein